MSLSKNVLQLDLKHYMAYDKRSILLSNSFIGQTGYLNYFSGRGIYLFSENYIEGFVDVWCHGCYPRSGKEFIIYGPLFSEYDYSIIMNIFYLETRPLIVIYGQPNTKCQDIILQMSSIYDDRRVQIELRDEIKFEESYYKKIIKVIKIDLNLI